MRKLSLTLAFAVMFLVFGTGCLKDKGFENGQYGLDVPDSDIKAVAFPYPKKSYALSISASPQVINDVLAITLEMAGKAETDITVTLANTTGTAAEGDIKTYNDANGTDIQVYPSSLYSLPLTVTIPVGEKSIKIPLTVTNTTLLNLNLSYGIALTIVSASNGYQAVPNMKKMMVIFNVKNRLDGVYEITGEALRAGDAVFTGTFGPYEREFKTSGAASVQWDDGRVQWANGSNATLPDGYEPNITVDPVTNLITSITSVSGIMQTVPTVRTDIVGLKQRYDPATKTLYFEFTYGAGTASRLFSFKAKWLHAR